MVSTLFKAIALSATRRLRGSIRSALIGLVFLVVWVSSTSGWVAWGQAQPASEPLFQSMWSDVESSTVIYLGETHDQSADHEAQLDLIQQLYGTNPRLVIGMEMFQRPYQEFLDQYLSGTLSEVDLRTRSEFDTRWGYDWESYAPILRFAKEFGIPVLALNVPTEVTHYVAQNGLDGLDPDLARWIPPPDELDLGPPAYRERLHAVYDEIHQGNSYSLSFDHFFLAQILWDETMAMAIADYIRTHPQEQVVVLAGQGHINYGYGIPRRVARRLADWDDFKQRSLLLNPTSDQRTVGQGVIADYFWPLSQDLSP